MGTAAALYCRVSTSEQKEEGTSLDTQRQQGLAKARELGWTVHSEHIIQEDWTGKDLGRPGLVRLLELASSGRVQGIIIFTLDRLYRPENDGDEWRVFELLQRFQDAGADVVWVDPSLPSGGPLSSVITFLDAWRSGRERRALIERTTRGLLEKARRGKVISASAAPFGYRFDPGSSTLGIHDDEAKIVRLIFHLYTQERLSLLKLADSLNRLGISPPGRGHRWHGSSIARMLGNETYAGTLWHHRWQDVGKTKPKFVERPKDDQVAVPVPAIIPREVFVAAKERLKQNKRLARRNTKREYLLSGLVKHVCGSRMGGCSNKGILYYRCYKSLSFKAPIDNDGVPQRCDCRWVNGKALESAVWETVTDLIRHPELLMRELERLTQPDSATREALEEELAVIEKRLEDLPREERRLVDGYRKGFYADFMMREEMDRVKEERAGADERRKELERQLSLLEKAMSYRESLEGFAGRVSVGLDTMGFDERRELLRLLVDEVVYEDGEVTIKTILPVDGVRLHPEDQRVYGGREGETSS